MRSLLPLVLVVCFASDASGQALIDENRPLNPIPKAIAIGDSITAEGPSQYPAVLDVLLGTGWEVHNGGVSGTQLTDMLSRYTTSYRPRGYARAILLGGVNDIAVFGADGATALSRWTSLADTVRADGLTLIAVTVLPFKGNGYWTEARQGYLDTLNAGIAAYCAANSVVCVDANADFEDSGAADAMKAAYDYGDHLHINQAGRDRLAAIVQAAWP